MIEVELRVAHFEVVRSDHQLAVQLSILQGPGALPLASPVRIQLMVLAAEDQQLVTFVLSLLLDTEETFALSELGFNVLGRLLAQVFVESAACLFHWLRTDDSSFKSEWIEAESHLQIVVVVEEVTIVISSIASYSHQTNLFVSEVDVVSVGLVPLSDCGDYIFVLLKGLEGARQSSKMVDDVLHLPGWGYSDKILDGLNTVCVH